MTDIDLNALSLAELKQLEKNVAKAIASFEDRRKAEARAAAEAVAKEHGFSLGELAEMTPAQKRAAAAPKYRHPENPRSPGAVAAASPPGSPRGWRPGNPSKTSPSDRGG